MGVIFNERDAADGRPHGRRRLPGRRLHGRVGLRGRACCAAARDRYHRLGFIIGVHRRRDRDPGPDGRRRRAGPLGLQQPADEVRRDRDGARRPAATCRRCSSGTSTPRATVVGGIPIPGLASILSDPSTGTSTVIQGLDEVPADDRPTIHEVNVAHLAWDVMVGLGTLLFLLTLWWWASWIFRRDMPRSKWFLRASAARRGACRDRHGGGLDRERGRAPALDRLREDEGRGRRHREHRDLDHLHRRGASSTSASASPRSWCCAR